MIAYVTNDADNPPLGDSDFHTDYTFHPEIAAVAVLQAQAVTARGGRHDLGDIHAATTRCRCRSASLLSTL